MGNSRRGPGLWPEAGALLRRELLGMRLVRSSQRMDEKKSTSSNHWCCTNRYASGGGHIGKEGPVGKLMS